MAETIIRSDFGEIEETLSKPSTWLDQEIRRRVTSTTAIHSEESTRITLYAEVKSTSKAKTVLQVASWSPSDLYGYSEAPRIELLNVFGQLLDACEAVRSAHDQTDFELKTIELWAELSKLNNFLGISAAHDELIATLQVVSAATSGVLDLPKLDALTSTFTILHSAINITDDVLDALMDALETAGFDLQWPMQFEAEGEPVLS